LTVHTPAPSKVSRAQALPLAWLAGIALFGASARVAAQPAPEDTEVEATYAKLVSDAVTAFDAGKYRESRELLAQAHQLRPNARTLRGMGLAAFEDGRYSLTVLDLDGALAETRQPMSATQRTEVEQLRSEADALTARYRVSGMPPNSELRVDGEEPVWDPAGLLLIDQGAHTVILTLNAGEIRSWSVRAQGGQTSDFDLGPPPSAADVAVEAPAAPPVELAVVPAPVIEETTPTGISNVWAYAAVAGAAVTGSLAIWQWHTRESEVEKWNSDDCLRSRRTRRANCGEHEAAYQRAEAWAWVTGGATVALSAGAVTLLLLNREEHQPQTARPICVPGPAAFACRVSF
jgi:hypothetical protein